MESNNQPLTHRDPNPALLTIVATLMFCAYASLLPIWDDAFISFRYSDNLVGGSGLVYNPGERVEGYTNFLWVMLLAATRWMTLPPWIASRLFGFFSVIGILWLLMKKGSKYKEIGHAGAIACAWYVCFNQQVIRWSSSGLETGLVTFLVLLAFFESIEQGNRKVFRAACFWILALLCRPDAAVILVSTLLALSFEKENRKAVLQISSLIILLGLPYLLWKKYYFGLWLPATYHTRMGYTLAQFQRGGAFLIAYLSRYTVVLTGLISLPLWLRKENILSRAAGFAILTHYALVVFVGGDWMEFRFFSVTTPFEVILCVASIRFLWFKRIKEKRTLTRFNRMVAISICTLLVVTTVIRFPPNLFSNISLSSVIDHRTNRSSIGELMGRFSRTHRMESEWLVTPYAEVALASRLPCFNPLGLTTISIATSEVGDMGKGLVAHEKVDWETGLQLNPIFLVPDYTLDQNVVLDKEIGKGVLHYVFPGYSSNRYQAIRTDTSDGHYSKFLVRLDICDTFLTWWNIHFQDVPPRKL